MRWIVQMRRLSAILIILRKGKYSIPFSFKAFLFQNLITYLRIFFQYIIIGIECSYEDVQEIIDVRWDNQLHRPLHATAYYLNPHFHYEPNFRIDDSEVKEG